MISLQIAMARILRDEVDAKGVFGLGILEVMGWYLGVGWHE